MTQIPNTNLFYVGGALPPNEFVGRSSNINAAFDTIVKRTSLAIQGSSGMGKSSLLGYIASPDTWRQRELNPDDAFIIFLNCFEIQPFTLSGFWEAVLNSLKLQSQNIAVLQSVIDEILLQGVYNINELRQLLAEIGKVNKFLVLLLDDFDAALYTNASYTEVEMSIFLSNFRNLSTHGNEQKYISVVLTSLSCLANDVGPPLTRGVSPWNNHYIQLYLKPFKEREVSKWFDDLSQKLSSQWLKEFQAGILGISGGNPILVQNAGYLLYSIWRDGEIYTPDEFVREYERSTRRFFSGAWNQSTDDEKTLLKLIALSHLDGRLNDQRKYTLDGVDAVLSMKERELRELEGRGILYHLEEDYRKVYVFTSSIMEWWVIKEIENSPDEPQLAEKEILFLNLSRGQIDQMKDIMKQVWQYKDAAKSAAGWVGELVGAFTQGFVGSGTS